MKRISPLALTTLSLLSAYLLMSVSDAAISPANLPAMKMLYAGNFELSGKKLRFEVGALSQVEEGRSRFVALIKNSQGETQGTCERTLSGEAPFDVNSMLLTCEGLLKPSQKTTAKFSFSDQLKKPKLLIQKGKKMQEIELQSI